MRLPLHPALRALALTLGGLVLLVGGTLGAYSGLRALAQAGAPAPPVSVATAAPAPPAQGADPTATFKRARLLARQSHGDWARVPADDQRLLDSVTGGHGREMLRAAGREQSVPRRVAGARPMMSPSQQHP